MQRKFEIETDYQRFRTEEGCKKIKTIQRVGRALKEEQLKRGD